MVPILISADEVKKTINKYQPSKAEKFHRRSAKEADKLFERELKQNKEKEVIFMCGGSASGKTEFFSKYLTDFKGIVFDGTLSTQIGAQIKIKKVQKVRKKPIIYAVLPDDLKRAFIAFLERERKFSDQYFYKTHAGARKTLFWLAQNYPEIKLRIFESSYVKRDKMDFREFIFNQKQELMQFLQNIQYTEEQILKNIKL